MNRPRVRWSPLAVWRRLRTNGFLGPVLTLVTGAAAAQALVFAARPALTRLFTPDEFGVLTVFVTLVTVLSTVASGRYEDALMLPEDDGEARGVLALALLAISGTALATGVALAVFPGLDDVLGGPAVQPALVVLPGAVAVAGWSLALETWHTRTHRFGAVSAGRTAQSAVVVGIQLAAGIAAVGATGLVAGAAAGFVTGALWLGVAYLITGGGPLPLRSMPALARRYIRFPLFSAPAALLNVLSSRAPILLLAAIFTTGVVGQFGIAFGTLALPLGLLTGAVGQVFFVRAAEAHREDRLGPLTLVVLRQLAVATVYPSLVVFVAGPSLFAFVFGAEWAVAGTYARLLAPWLLLFSIAVPLTRVFDVTERQRADLGFSIGLFVTQTGAFAVAALTANALVAVAVLGLVGMLCRIVHVGWILHLAGTPLKSAVGAFLSIVGYALPFLLLVVAAEAWTDSGLVITLAALVGGAGYLTLAVWRGALREPA